MKNNIRVRFAPSPTGHLHIGGLRTALFNWLFARHNKGAFLLRIEDTDLERSKQEFTDSILASLAWAHLDWDEPYIIQSQRVAEHQRVAEKLLAEGKAYKCYCTSEEVLARRPAVAVVEGETFSKYDGFCARRTDTPNKPAAIRFKLPEDTHVISFNDLIRGPISVGIDQLDDFVIVRSDGTPMYNFVVVVDDASSKITYVIRGEDHISNTPKQILLYQACGYDLPEFGHLPNILGPDGQKLSKRNGATSVIEYKDMGYLPEAFINYLARLGWGHGDQEIFTIQELIQYFTLEHVGKKGSIFDATKLDWVNGHYMRHTNDEQLLEIMVHDIRPSLISDFPLWKKEQILVLINIYKQRAKTLKELVHDMQGLYSAPTKFLRSDITAWITPDTITHLKELSSQFQNADQFSHDLLSAAVKEFSKQKNIKLVALAQPLRIALIGKSAGPGVFELMPIIGKKESLVRIATFIEAVTQNKMIE